MFELMVFTASVKEYCDKVLKIIDPKAKYFRHRLCRDDCTLYGDAYLKDLRLVGRDLSQTAIVDNSPVSFGLHIDNGIPIKSFYDDPADRSLLELLPLLRELHSVADVRPVLIEKYSLRKKVFVSR